jgi:hypothetical protein
MTKWHSGPPPSIGWWPASVNENPKFFRWYDGAEWSASVTESDNAEYAAACAVIKATPNAIPKDIQANALRLVFLYGHRRFIDGKAIGENSVKDAIRALIGAAPLEATPV